LVKTQCFYHDPRAAQILGWALRNLLRRFTPASGSFPVVVCVGTDRITGDSLGPLVGTLLQERHPGLPVYGTLAEPLHAANLGERLPAIRQQHADRPVVAVDSALGESGHVGKICVYRGALRPGSGLNKALPEVGDVHLMGIVDVGYWNALDYLALQNVRLHLVWEIAKVMVRAIEIGIGISSLPGMEAATAAEVGDGL